jgi:hypothetical protein
LEGRGARRILGSASLQSLAESVTGISQGAATAEGVARSRVVLLRCSTALGRPRSSQFWGGQAADDEEEEAAAAVEEGAAATDATAGVPPALGNTGAAVSAAEEVAAAPDDAAPGTQGAAAISAHARLGSLVLSSLAPQLAACSGSAIVGALCASARLRLAPLPRAWGIAATARLRAQLHTLCPAQLAAAASALASLRARPPLVLGTEMSLALLARAHEASPADTARLLIALARLGLRPRVAATAQLTALMASLAVRASPRDLCAAVWALAVVTRDAPGHLAGTQVRFIGATRFSCTLLYHEVMPTPDLLGPHHQ